MLGSISTSSHAGDPENRTKGCSRNHEEALTTVLFARLGVAR
jgi:hypothetical protein